MLSIKLPWPRNELDWIVFKTVLRGAFVIVRYVLVVIFAFYAMAKEDQLAVKGVPGCKNETSHRPCSDAAYSNAVIMPALITALFVYCVYKLHCEYAAGLKMRGELWTGREVTKQYRPSASSNVNDPKAAAKANVDDQNKEMSMIKLTKKAEEPIQRLYMEQVVILTGVEEIACYCYIRCRDYSGLKADNLPEVVCNVGCYQDPFLTETKPMLFSALLVYGVILSMIGVLEMFLYAIMRWFDESRSRIKANMPTATNQEIDAAQRIV